MTEEAQTETNFDFYLKFAKPLVLNLSKPDDRVLAAAWIQKLRDEGSGEQSLRTDYLKLLLFVLQRKKLIGIFKENPAEQAKLDDIPGGNLYDVAKELLESEHAYMKEKAAKATGAASGDFPPYSTEHSADLLEYSAAQDIPNFGVHAYYAISNEPLPNWEKIGKAVFPRGVTSVSERASGAGGPPPSRAATTVSEPALDGGRPRPSPGRPKSKQKPRPSSRSRSRSRSPKDIKPPTTTLGSSRPDDERSPPTWGSNLIGVSDPPERDTSTKQVPSDLPDAFLGSYFPEAPPPCGTPPQPPSQPCTVDSCYEQGHSTYNGAPTGAYYFESPRVYLDQEAAYKTPSPRGRLTFSPPSVPYRTPPRPGTPSHPSLPYKTPSPRIPYGPEPMSPSTPSLPYKTPPPRFREPYTPDFPGGWPEPFYLESPPSFLEAESPPALSPGDSFLGFPYKTGSPKVYVGTAPPPEKQVAAIGGRDYDLAEMQELGLNASILESEAFNLDDIGDLNMDDISEVSVNESSPFKRSAIDEDLDAFDRMIEEFEKDDSVCPVCPPGATRRPQSPEQAAAAAKKGTRKKPAAMKKTSRTSVRSKTSARSAGPSRSTTSALRRPPTTAIRTGPAPQIPGARPAANVPKRLPSGSRVPAPKFTRIPLPGTTGIRPPQRPQQASMTGSRVSVLSVSRLPGPGGFQAPPAGRSRLPVSGGSRSRLPVPGGSRLPLAKGSRLPVRPGPSASQLPRGPVAPTRPYSPVLTTEAREPLFLQSPPSFLVEASLAHISPPQVRPQAPVSPKTRSPSAGPVAIPSPGRASSPAAPAGIDRDLLKELGLEEEDLKDFSLEGLDFGDVSKITVESIFEENADFGVNDRTMNEEFEEFERQLAELEREHAEDIALYGSPEKQPVVTSPRQPIAASTARSFTPERAPSPARLATPDRQYSPVLTKEAREPFFLESPPSFLDEASLADISSPRIPSPKSRTPSPKSRTPSPQARIPLPQVRARSPQARISSPQDRTPSPHAVAARPPSPGRPAAAGIDLGLLEQLGLQEDDLKDISLEGLDFGDVSKITVESIEYEGEADFDLKDKSISEQLEEFERQITELERENAEDIALYGSPKGSPVQATSPARSLERQPPVSSPHTPARQLSPARSVTPERPFSPVLTTEAREPFFLESPPSFLGEDSLADISTPSPVRRPARPVSPERRPPERPVSRLPQPGASRSRIPGTGSSRLPVAGSAQRMPAAGGTRLPVPGGTRLPVPPGSRLPVPGGSRLPVPGGSRLPVPGAGVSRIPGTRSKAAERIVLTTKPPSPPYSPKLTEEAREPFFLESPPGFMSDASLEGITTPSPRAVRAMLSPGIAQQLFKDLGLDEDDLQDNELEDVSKTTIESVVYEEEMPPPIPQGSPVGREVISEANKRLQFSAEPESLAEFEQLEKEFSAQEQAGVGHPSPRGDERFLESEQQPEFVSIEEEYDKAPVSERSPAINRDALKTRMQELMSDLSERKEGTPADSGVPITTPRRSPSPKRPTTTIRVGEGEDMVFEIPPYESPRGPQRDTLYWETPPREYYGSPGSPPDLRELEDMPDPHGLPRPKRFSPIKKSDISSPRVTKTVKEVVTTTQEQPDAGPSVKHTVRKVTTTEQPQRIEPAMPVFGRDAEDIDLYVKPERRELARRAAQLIRDVPDPFQRPHEFREWDLPAVPEGAAGLLEETPPPAISSPEPSSPIYSPRFKRSIQEHQYTEKFFDKNRPKYSNIILSGSKKVKLQRKSRPPSLGFIQEQPQPVELPPADYYVSPAGTHVRTPVRPRPPPGMQPVRLFDESPPKDLQLSPERPFDLFDESPPMGMVSSEPPRPPESPISSPESPFALRMRLLQGDEPPYYSLDEFPIFTGRRTKTLQRRSAPPPLHKLREVAHDYREEHVPFLAQVEAAEKKWTKPRRRIRTSTPMERVLESPVKVPRMFEVDDVTGFGPAREELERRFADLPELDLPRPEARREPMKPPLHGWKTPPHLKVKRPERPRRVPGILPEGEMGESVRLMARPREIIFEEAPPSDLIYSPPAASPETLKQLRPQFVPVTKRLFSPEGEPDLEPLDAFFSNLSDEQMPGDLQYSPPQATPPPLAYELPPADYYGSPSGTYVRIPPLEALEPVDLFGESPPKDLFSPEPAIQPQSPPESPFSCKLRVWEADEPPYYSQDEFPIFTGRRTKVIKRRSAPPSLHKLREVPEGYKEENVPFLAQVEKATGEWKRPPRRMKIVPPRMASVRESPVKVPGLLEVEDRTGFRRTRQQLEQKFADLPPLPTIPPQDLFGVKGYFSPYEEERGPLDLPLPENLPPPMRPPTVLHGWTTPPGLKVKRPQRPRPAPVPGLMPEGEFRESSRLMALPRDFIEEEMPPMDMPYSPPPMSPRTLGQLRPQFAPPTSPERLQRMAEATADILSEEPMPADLQYSPIRAPPRARPPAADYYGSPGITYVRTPVTSRPLELLEPINLFDESPPKDLFSPEPAIPPQSPPESPFSCKLRVWEADEPPYYSRDEFPILTGRRTRVIKRHSAPPELHKLREVPADYREEHVPFLAQVEKAPGKWTRPPRKLRIAPPGMSPVREDPMNVPGMFEVEDTTGFRKVREQLEKRFSDLPNLPKEHTEELMGTAARVEWQQPQSELDRDLPENLPAPVRPPTVVPGWQTPPRLRKRVKSPEPYEVKLIPGLRDVLFHEMPPPELAETPPRSPASRDSPITPDMHMHPTPRPSPFQTPESPRTPPLIQGKPGAVFKESPQFLVLEMPPDEFVPAGSPPSPTYWQRKQRQRLMMDSPEQDSFEEHEKELIAEEEEERKTLQRLLRSMHVSPTQNESLVSITRETHRQLMEETPPDQMLEFEAMEVAMEAQRTPEGEKVARAQYKHVQQSPDRTLEEFEQRERQIAAEEAMARLPKGMEHLQKLVSDVPEPYMPRRKPAFSPKVRQVEPAWSPKLPNVPQYADLIDEEWVPQGVWGYSSPKTPSPVKQAVSPQSPRTPMSDIWSMQPADAVYLEDVAPPEDFIASPTSPESPPTPPNIADYYQAHTPPSPGSPTDLAQALREHQYTKHRYDKARRLMTNRVQIKNRAVPIRRRSKLPGVAPIPETYSDMGSPLARATPRVEQLIPISPPPPVTRTVTEEIVETVDLPLIDKAVPQVGLGFGLADRGLGFVSPPRPERVAIPPRYQYGRTAQPIAMPDVFSRAMVQERLLETTPPEDMPMSPPYLVESPEAPGSPPLSPSFAQSVQEHEYTKKFFDPNRPLATSRVMTGRRAVQLQRRSRPPNLPGVVEQEPTRLPPTYPYELPVADYYGSPGRLYVRTPSAGRHARPIVEEPVVEEAEERDVAGFQWMG